MQWFRYDGMVENVPDGSETAIIAALRAQLEERTRELRTQVEAFEEQRRALEARNNQLSQEFAKVISVISHEMRTPLTSITGYIDLLADGDVGPLAPEQLEFLQIVRASASRLAQIIIDVVDISRIEAGAVDLHPRSLNIALQIRRVIEVLQLELAEYNHRIVLDIADDLPFVLGDEQRLDQILRNLITNACKYMPTPGTVTIRAERDGPHVRVDIEDTGVGLTPEQQAQVFDKFYRAKHQRTRAVEGTGLGLTIARSLLRMHGGDIKVTSVEGQGSTFSFTVPVIAGD